MHLVRYLDLAQEKEARHGVLLWLLGERSHRPMWGGVGPYLEVRAVVVVPVHNLPLPAVPGQHRDHLPPRQVCVELRGEDVDSRGRQGLRGQGEAGLDHVGNPDACAPLVAGTDHGPRGSNA